jgi:hypothetical protein
VEVTLSVRLPCALGAMVGIERLVAFLVPNVLGLVVHGRRSLGFPDGWMGRGVPVCVRVRGVPGVVVDAGGLAGSLVPSALGSVIRARRSSRFLGGRMGD